MRIARIVLLTLIGIAAVVITLTMGPTPTNYQDEVSAALASSSVDNSRAQGAPQQTVVNGWIARDLLAIISKQLDAQQRSSDKRIAPLLMLVVLAVVVLGVTRQENPVSPAQHSGGELSPNAVKFTPPLGDQALPPPTSE